MIISRLILSIFPKKSHPLPISSILLSTWWPRSLVSSGSSGLGVPSASAFSNSQPRESYAFPIAGKLIWMLHGRIKTKRNQLFWSLAMSSMLSKTGESTARSISKRQSCWISTRIRSLSFPEWFLTIRAAVWQSLMAKRSAKSSWSSSARQKQPQQLQQLRKH